MIKHCGRSAERGQSQEAKLRRTVDHHDVVCVTHLRERFSDSRKKEGAFAAPRHQFLWRFVLEFHEFELAGDDMQICDVCRADDLRHFPTARVVADCAVNRLVLADIKFWLMAKKGRKTGLRIEIDRQHAISAKRQILRQMRRSGGLSATALEVHHGDNLQGLAVFPMRNITPRTFATAIELNTKRIYVLD